MRLESETMQEKRDSVYADRRQEVAEYAQYLGMDPDEDQDFLWIAELALTAPLPMGWSEHEVCACILSYVPYAEHVHVLLTLAQEG